MPRDTKEEDRHEASSNESEDRAVNRRNILLGTSTLVAAAALTSGALAQAQKAAPAAPAAAPAPAPAAASGRKPNILIIWGDDVGVANISAYSNGLMGYETPGIDRIGREGIGAFLHYYGEQSCTAGRAAFLTGQHGIRSGLTKVGFPGAPMGMSQLDPSIGGLLKNLGYATGQFGKNHVGDRNASLPTVNGFDEFFGNLYHLNAEEEPELPDYPKDPAYLAKFGPRGVLKCKATDRDDPTVDPRFGKIGKQTIEDTGALTKKRMETIDDETSAAAIDLHETTTGRRQAVLLLVQRYAHAPTYTRPSRSSGALHPRRQRVHRRHAGARRHRRVPCSKRWTTWASRTTPSSSTPVTTVRT